MLNVTYKSQMYENLFYPSAQSRKMTFAVGNTGVQNVLQPTSALASVKVASCLIYHQYTKPLLTAFTAKTWEDSTYFPIFYSTVRFLE